MHGFEEVYVHPSVYFLAKMYANFIEINTEDDIVGIDSFNGLLINPEYVRIELESSELETVSEKELHAISVEHANKNWILIQLDETRLNEDETMETYKVLYGNK